MDGVTPARDTGEVTLDEIARAAGVSRATASRVLNGSTRSPRPANRDRVLAAARRLGYSPDLRAQATAGRVSMLVLIVVSDLTDAYCSRVAADLVRGVQEEGLTAFVTVCPSALDEARAQIRSLRGHRPRGIAMVLTQQREGWEVGLRDELREITDHGGRVIVVAGDAESRSGTPAQGLRDLVAELVRGSTA